MPVPASELASGILLVDDTVENLRVLAGMLTTNGFDVRPVTSGHDALNAVAHATPDLILLDVMMPDMDGFEVCARLKSSPRTRDIPVIFLTALNEMDHKIRGFDVGGNDYITKPFQMQEVLSRVRNQLALQSARRDLAVSLQRLQELEQLRDDLVNMVVHDMRSPLMVLMMDLAMLKSADRADAAELFDSAERTTQLLNQMTNTLLDVSRLEQGQMPLQRAPCDLRALAERVCREMNVLEPGRSLTCGAEQPVTVSCDESLIARVLSNLISNGIKHTPAEGALSVCVSARDGAARVSVQDQGPGVPAEVRPRLFEKFGAMSVRKERRYHSAGLGLAFCKLAVQAHSGTIGVDSAPGGGSSFWFELPA